MVKRKGTMATVVPLEVTVKVTVMGVEAMVFAISQLSRRKFVPN